MTDYLPQAPDVLTIPEAAQALRISRSAMQKLVANSEVEHIEIAGKPLIFKASLEDSIDKSRQVCYNNRVGTSGPAALPQEPPHLDNRQNTPVAAAHPIPGPRL